MFSVFQNMVCVPSDQRLKEEILSEVHRSKYTIHRGSTRCTVTFVKTIRGMERKLISQFYF